MDTKLAAALDYLRARHLYILDADNRFTYTPSHATDVRQTIGDEITCLRGEERAQDPFADTPF